MSDSDIELTLVAAGRFGPDPYPAAVDVQTGISAPFTAADSGDASHRTTSAIRSGGTSLPHDDSGIDSRFAGVSISEGTSTLQRTPSLAMAFASAMTPAFDAA